MLPLVGVAFSLAALFHADMNDRPLFDTLWMTGLFVGTFSVLPQLWLIARTRGSIEALVCHHVTAMAASRIMSGLFMWYAWDDITCKQWIVGYNHAIVAILAAHALHLVLLADFLYCYIHAVTSQGLDCRIDMQAELEV